MTTTPTTTAAERVEVTLHQLGYLIGRHHLPAPRETRVRLVRVSGMVVVDLDFAQLHDLNRWAEATDAVVIRSPDYEGLQRVARTVIDDIALRMSCFGEALTP